MDQQDREYRKQQKSSRNYLIGLCAAGLLINYLLGHLALRLEMPLYLDNIGSALAAALGGYLPGIIVGFFTNIVNCVGDYTNAYYGSLTILIAIASAWFASNGYYSFRKPWRLLAVIAVFAFIGGGLGSLLTRVLYGFEFGVGTSAQLARQIYAGGVKNEFLAQLSADMIVDLVDKTITVLVVAVLLYVLPKELKKRLYYAGWQYNPVTLEKHMLANKKRARLMSLRSKIVMLVSAGMIITGVIVIVMGSILSWIGSFVLYGFGELVENSSRLVELKENEK